MRSEPRVTVADVRVTLPADWWATPLAVEARWRRAVEALLDRQFDGWQDQPLLRSQLRRTISAQAEAAAAAGAQLLGLSLLVGARPGPDDALAGGRVSQGLVGG